uniref:Uncharacterized protein n=1 Tax=Panagrolaimus sp. ES5 TaxID=591445 RepID=A0AC34G4E3_9BILA
MQKQYLITLDSDKTDKNFQTFSNLCLAAIAATLFGNGLFRITPDPFPLEEDEIDGDFVTVAAVTTGAAAIPSDSSLSFDNFGFARISNDSIEDERDCS